MARNEPREVVYLGIVEVGSISVVHLICESEIEGTLDHGGVYVKHAIAVEDEIAFRKGLTLVLPGVVIIRVEVLERLPIDIGKYQRREGVHTACQNLDNSLAH